LVIYFLLCCTGVGWAEVDGEVKGSVEGETVDSYFNSNGVSIRYLDQGDGQAIVLIHGFTGNADGWTQLQGELAKDHRVIAIDCRGHGRSDKPDEYGRAMVDDLLRLLDHLGIAQAVFVGYSMGAEISLRMAVENPTRVRALIAGGSAWSGEHDVANYLRMGDALRSSGSFGPMLADAWPEGQTPSAEDIAAVDSLLAGNDVAALAKIANAMPEIINLTEAEVASIAVPTLAITGALDPERSNHERMQGVVQDLTLVVIEGADHMAALGHPEFQEAISKFVQTIDE
jgi:pimeloyl-ACP methyl ester carboxylesterase